MDSDGPLRLSQSELQRLMIAYGWELERAISESEFERVIAWANDPSTPRELVDRVIDGGTSIKRFGSEWVLKPRRNMQAKELRKAFDRLMEIQSANPLAIDPSGTNSLFHNLSGLPEGERKDGIDKLALVMRHLKWDEAFVQAFLETGIIINQVNETSVSESDSNVFREAMTQAVAKGIGGNWGGRLPSLDEVTAFSEALQSAMELYDFRPPDSDDPDAQTGPVAIFSAGPSPNVEGEIEVTARCGGVSIERAKFSDPNEAVSWIVVRGMPPDAASDFIAAVPTCEKGYMLTFNTRDYGDWKRKQTRETEED